MAYGTQATQNVTPISHNVLFILVANIIFTNVIGLFVVAPAFHYVITGESFSSLAIFNIEFDNIGDLVSSIWKSYGWYSLIIVASIVLYVNTFIYIFFLQIVMHHLPHYFNKSAIHLLVLFGVILTVIFYEDVSKFIDEISAMVLAVLIFFGIGYKFTKFKPYFTLEKLALSIFIAMFWVPVQLTLLLSERVVILNCLLFVSMIIVRAIFKIGPSLYVGRATFWFLHLMPWLPPLILFADYLIEHELEWKALLVFVIVIIPLLLSAAFWMWMDRRYIRAVAKLSAASEDGQ